MTALLINGTDAKTLGFNLAEAPGWLDMPGRQIPSAAIAGRPGETALASAVVATRKLVLRGTVGATRKQDIRPTIAMYQDVAGIYQIAQPYVLRDQAYMAGVLQPPLIETASVNSCLQSRNLTLAPWATNGAFTKVQNAVGLDGTANSATTIGDTDAGVASFFSQNIVVPVDANTHVASFWIKKDSDTTRFIQCLAVITGGTPVQYQAHLNTQTGAFIQTIGVGVGAIRVIDAGLWWVMEIRVANNASAGNNIINVRIYPAVGNILGTVSVAATGTCVVGQVQVELSRTEYSSPIFTTTTPVARAADLVTGPAPARFNIDALKLALLASPLALTFADHSDRQVFASLESFVPTTVQGALGALVQELLSVDLSLKLLNPLTFDIAQTVVALGVNRLSLGTGPVKPVVTITGVSNNPVISLFNSAGVAIASLTLTLATIAGDTLIIDMDAKTIKKNGVSQIAALTAGDFFSIDPTDQTNFGGLGPYITSSSGVGTVSYSRAWR